jgi:hypothetical protein
MSCGLNLPLESMYLYQLGATQHAEWFMAFVHTQTVCGLIHLVANLHIEHLGALIHPRMYVILFS